MIFEEANLPLFQIFHYHELRDGLGHLPELALPEIAGSIRAARSSEMEAAEAWVCNELLCEYEAPDCYESLNETITHVINE